MWGAQIRLGQVKSLADKIRDIAIALRMLDGMLLFRSSLRQVIAASLDYKPGSVPSPRDLRLNEQLLSMFLPGDEPMGDASAAPSS